eukprot:2284742-Alexandrium_andersonii.AAC.1
MNECIPKVVQAMRAGVKETGVSKCFSASATADDVSKFFLANSTADDSFEMIARGKYVSSQLGSVSASRTFLVDAGTALRTQRGYTAFARMALSRVIDASGFNVGNTAQHDEKTIEVPQIEVQSVEKIADVLQVIHEEPIIDVPAMETREMAHEVFDGDVSFSDGVN